MKATVGVEQHEHAGVAFFLPEEIVIDNSVNVRPWSSADDEQEEIAQLARSIRRDGQINPITVRWNLADEKFHLISGRRRVAAIALINKELNDPMPVKCSVYHGLEDEQAFRQALMENAQRKNASAMDNASNILSVRSRFGWTDGKSTRKVADYFGMSPAWVTTHEKLLDLDAGTQGLIQQNGWSAQAAMDLVSAQSEKRTEVVERSEELAEVEAKQTGKKKKVKGRHVRQAIRERQAETVVKARPAKELREFFGQFDSDQYYSEVRNFVQYFDKWAQGGGTDRTMREKFDEMITWSADRIPIPDKMYVDASKVKPEASVKAAVKGAVKKAVKKAAQGSTGKSTKVHSGTAKAKGKIKPKK